jgi:periplasmic protein TonB
MFEENAQGIPLEMEPASVSVPPLGVNWQAFGVPVFASQGDSAAGEKQLFAAIFVASCFLHGAVGLYVKANASRAPLRVTPHQVEIEFAHPPPPPPPPPPTALPEPPPPVPASAPRAQKTTPPPTAGKQETVTSNLPAQEPTSALPVSDEGTLPPAPAGTVTQLAVAPAPAAPPAPTPIVEAREGANYSKNPRPPYPHLAQREEWEGTVTLRVQVLPSGRPGVAQVQKSAGHSVLDEAALDAVKGWSFVPATQGGRPVAGWVTVPIAFQLH